jgi:hypothetical protein
MATQPGDRDNPAPDLQNVVYATIQAGAAPVATSLNMPNLIIVDQGALGDFPWFWQSGTSFNGSTFKWLNSLFAYDRADGYAQTNGQALTTSLFNVMSTVAYVLDTADAAALNKSVLANATVANTIVNLWTQNVGPIPATDTSLVPQLTYVTTQVLAWGATGLTLGQLRTSVNPMALLPNIPLGGDQVVSALMTYLANTSSVANIQAAVIAFNAEVAKVKNNIAPQPALSAVQPGFMTATGPNGTVTIEVEVDIVEDTGLIQSKLLPVSGPGNNFSASFAVTKQSSDTVQVSSSSGVGTGDLGFFLSFGGNSSQSYNMFSADASLTTCSVTLTYNGVTTVTPKYAAYNVTDGTGWWLPDPIEEAANPTAGQSGYQFTPVPAYDFGVNGDFGAIERLMISQQPIVSLSYVTSNYAAFQQIFKEQSNWNVSFLGIPIAGGSSSYYQCNSSYDSETTTVTITMTPVGVTTPVAPASQLATVIGAQFAWPGASQQQNRAGI